MIGRATLAVVGILATPALSVLTATYTNLPYQAYTGNGVRGPQQGYNICNSTTQNQLSMCQTLLVNGLDDFCLWGSPTSNSDVGNVEAEMVAYCTKATHGSRLIPDGTLTGVQFIKTPDYVQVTGKLVQTGIGLASDDGGGQLDPHGADGLGNPIGGLVFTNAFASSNGDTNSFIQAVEWNNQVGSGIFCLKACDPSRPNAAQLCNYQYDLLGCTYNAPAAYQDNVFESCSGDSQDPVGVYTGANGVVSTYTLPAQVITTIPYTPRIPASSACTPFSSADLFASSTDSSTGTGTDTGGSNPTASSGSNPPSGKSKSNKGAIIGGVVGGVFGAAILIGIILALVFWRRRRDQKVDNTREVAEYPPEVKQKQDIPPVIAAPWSIPASPSPQRLPAQPGTPAPTFYSNPPDYRATSPRSVTSGSRSMTLTGHNDELGIWAEENRDMIAPDLEQKLRDAHYRPSDNPDEIPAQEWRDLHGVGHFELKRIQELYSRRSTMGMKAKDVHGSGQGGPSWRPS